MSATSSIDRDYFAAHKDKLEYVRAPLPDEFANTQLPADARVRVFLINRRTLVKVLERPGGERLATVIDAESGAEPARRAA